jgi:hypothetical protein
VNNYLTLLSAIQVLNMLAYWWVQRNFFLPRLIQPKIFRIGIIRIFLVVVPTILGIFLMVLAFFLIDSPWLFIGLSVAGFVAFATPR